jgi:hypothetical protein
MKACGWRRLRFEFEYLMRPGIRIPPKACILCPISPFWGYDVHSSNRGCGKWFRKMTRLKKTTCGSERHGWTSTPPRDICVCTSSYKCRLISLKYSGNCMCFIFNSKVLCFFCNRVRCFLTSIILKRDPFPIPRGPVNFRNGHAVCLLWGWNLIFK